METEPYCPGSGLHHGPTRWLYFFFLFLFFFFKFCFSGEGTVLYRVCSGCIPEYCIDIDIVIVIVMGIDKV